MVLRCFDKDATEELYLINLMVFDSAEVDRWEGMVADWELALDKQRQKNLFYLKNYIKTNCCLITINVR